MKSTTLLLSLLLTAAAPCFGAIETWTSKDGKSAELELVSIMTLGGEKVGQFKTKDGKSVSIAASKLSDSDAARLDSWKPGDSASAKTATPAEASVFDKLLEPGNLIKVDGKHVGRDKDQEKPAKYYVFYYSASWCQPCHKFTPSLVEFYNKNKNANFEVYLITSDSEKDAMEGYMKEMNMPWPALQLAKTEKFKKDFNHSVDGIPFIAICKPDGTVVEKGNAFPMLQKLEAVVKQ